jgi:hypothetical protein
MIDNLIIDSLSMINFLHSEAINYCLENSIKYESTIKNF